MKFIFLHSFYLFSFLGACTTDCFASRSAIDYGYIQSILTKYSNHSKGWSPLNYAIEEGDYEAVLILLDYTDVNKVDDRFRPLDRLMKKLYEPVSRSAIQYSLDEAAVELIDSFIDHGADCSMSSFGAFPPREICYFGLNNIVLKIIRNGVDINDCNGAALGFSILGKQKSTVQILLENGADASLCSPYARAVSSKDPGMINFLIDMGVDINTPGQAPLIWAIQTLQVECVRILLKNGVDPNYKGPYYKQSALEVAIQLQNNARPYGNCEREDQIVQLLLEHGAKF